MPETVLVNAREYLIFSSCKARSFLIYLPLQKAPRSAIACSQSLPYLAEAPFFELPQDPCLSLPGYSRVRPQEFCSIIERATTLLT
ncbi:hypothetical protein ACFLX4_00385 [Chloroflexota bacterium]